jgi:hypothetical protein
VGISQLNLALLVALFSVLTTLITIGVPFFQPRKSNINLVLDGSEQERVTFIARNDGRTGGVIHIEQFMLIVRHNFDLQTGGSLVGGGHYIQADHEEKIELNMPPSLIEHTRSFVENYVREYNNNGDKFHLKEPDELFVCGFVISQNNFYTSTIIPTMFPFPCEDLYWIREGVNEGLQD